ncbi:Site-specific DNA recombinase [Singulisphaera sp. GP187]|uniref:recombinase family protein n=1 Tax=Singulisphaera sp. GP187 TaxID=1882752 RepID=UPI00092BF80C|nr:recombinase family protein [Singulisphaera sp. GP187]SIO38192.1 Site-specific DNA recombinase [Singulisphaera sp. GP187]
MPIGKATFKLKEAIVPTRRAVIYTRVSDTNEGNNGVSHEFQETACRSRAAELGYEVIEVFRDNFSGKYLHERPELSRLRELVRQGHIQAVFVWKLDRFSRRLAQRVICVQELRDHGCQYISATEEISDSPEGRLLESILGAIAEFEVERTLERSQAGIAVLKGRCLPICQGKARYGYRYIKESRTREIVEDEAKWVRKIFEWCVGGDSSMVIAARLNRFGVLCPAVGRGVKTRGASPQWHSSTIRSILKDASYAGAPMVSGKKRSTAEVSRKGHKRTEKTNPAEWWKAKDPTPPLVDKETFDHVQEALRSRRKTRDGRTAEYPHLLRGMVKCKICGRSMSPWKTKNPAGKTYFYFCCVSRQMGCNCGNAVTPIAWLDEQVWSSVVNLMRDKDAIEARCREFMKENKCDDLERDQAAHQSKISEARESIQRLIRMLGSSDDPEILTPLQGRLAELRSNIEAHQSEVRHIESKLFTVKNQAYALQHWAEACQVGGEIIDEENVTFDYKRKLLKALDLQVFAAKKSIQMSLGLPLVIPDSSPGLAASPTSPAARPDVRGAITTRR